MRPQQHIRSPSVISLQYHNLVLQEVSKRVENLIAVTFTKASPELQAEMLVMVQLLLCASAFFDF